MPTRWFWSNGYAWGTIQQTRGESYDRTITSIGELAVYYG